MKETLTLLEIITNVAPLVLTTIILSGVLGVFLYMIIKVIIPALREMNEASQIQRQSWKSLIDEQNRINKRLTEELQADLSTERSERAKLEKRVFETERELKEKTHQLEIATRQIAEFKTMLGAVNRELEEVKADREKVTLERDALRLEVDGLHREVEQLRTRLNELPATVPSDGNGKEQAAVEIKEVPGEKKS